jgi:hypothetical protein
MGRGDSIELLVLHSSCAKVLFSGRIPQLVATWGLIKADLAVRDRELGREFHRSVRLVTIDPTRKAVCSEGRPLTRDCI